MLSSQLTTSPYQRIERGQKEWYFEVRISLSSCHALLSYTSSSLSYLLRSRFSSIPMYSSRIGEWPHQNYRMWFLLFCGKLFILFRWFICIQDIIHSPNHRKFIRRGCVKNHSFFNKIRHYVKFNSWPEVTDCPQVKYELPSVTTLPIQGLSRYRLMDENFGDYFEQLCCSHDLCTSSPHE